MSHPSKAKLFIAWSKAMLAGATVGKPDYSRMKSSRTSARRRKRRRRRNRKQD